MTNRISNKSGFATFDKTQLCYRHWPATQQDSKQYIIMLHRGHEHSARLQDIVDNIQLDHFHVFAFDARGHGESPGLRGHANDFSEMVKDLDQFNRYIQMQYHLDEKNGCVVANSVGAVIASTWVHDYAPNIKAMVLAAPAFAINLYVPFANTGLTLINKIKQPAFVTSYVKSSLLTHDKAQQKLYDTDEMITSQISVNVLLTLNATAKRIVNDAKAIQTPTLVLSAQKDYVVKNSVQKKFYDRLGSVHKKMITLDGFYHGVLYEKDRQIAFDHCKHFIEACYANPAQSNTDLLHSDQYGFTFDEYQLLKESNHNLIKRAFYASQRMSMKYLGDLSDGMKIGKQYGFDSGLSLDHVYKNKASGKFGIGKMVDYFYINAIGWKGIRQRKINIQKNLDESIDALLANNQPVRILDIAAGPGRYLIETALKYQDTDTQVLIKDFTRANIEEGERIANELNCKNTTFAIHDAFDLSSYQNLAFKPNIILVSGLFELFPDNQQISQAIKGIQSVLAENGVIIYTGQPWHPQLELIAETLPNRDQQKWIMRRRTQKELDQLFTQFGGIKTKMDIDQWGIFTVSTLKNKSEHEIKSDHEIKNEAKKDENVAEIEHE